MSKELGTCVALHTAGKRITEVWIDALCTNQADNEERNNQVGQMWDIYLGVEE